MLERQPSVSWYKQLVVTEGTVVRIEDVISDIDVFHILLEGFFAEWEGTFDVMPADPPPIYLFEPRASFSDFCKKVRSTPKGNSLCIKCDKEHARLAAEKGGAISYICHAGMLDIATPILIGRELVATIFCGQCRPWNESQEREGQSRARETALRLGLQPRELLTLRKKARRASCQEVDNIKKRLDRVAAYVAASGEEKLKLLRIRNEILRESQHIQSVMNTLATIVDVNAFWSKLDIALERICDTIGADHAAIFVFREGKDSSYHLKSLARLARRDFQEVYPGNETALERMTNQMKPSIFDFEAFSEDTFCYDLASLVGDTPDKVAAIPFDLSSGRHAVMVFFLKEDRDIEHSLPVEREVDILSQIAPQIATAFQNCLLYTQQENLAKEKDAFLEDVAHQLIAPLSGLQADSDRLHRYFDRWDRERIDKQVLAIRGMSRWAARLTRNLVWVATTGGHSLQRRWTKITGILIGCAIDVQGMAAYKGLRVHVDEDATDALPQLFIDRDRFSQAMVNLLDNAVKYSESDTEIGISASHIGSEVCLSVTNYGIPLRMEDVDVIFERGYRSDEAMEKVPGGTGIGLPVARQIVELHGGSLSARPSKYDSKRKAHKVEFTITLPVKTKESK